MSDKIEGTTFCRGCGEQINRCSSHLNRCSSNYCKMLDRYFNTEPGWFDAVGNWIPRDRSKIHQFGYFWREHFTNPIIQSAIDAMSKIPISIKHERIQWENHPIYLELKNNINVKCEVDHSGKITGTVVSNLHLSEQWFLDFEKLFCLNNGVLNASSWQSPDFQGLLNFQIQLNEHFAFETKPAPKMLYEVGSDKPFYESCAVCNQCDQPNIYVPKTERYTCQKCCPS